MQKYIDLKRKREREIFSAKRKKKRKNRRFPIDFLFCIISRKRKILCQKIFVDGKIVLLFL